MFQLIVRGRTVESGLPRAGLRRFEFLEGRGGHHLPVATVVPRPARVGLSPVAVLVMMAPTGGDLRLDFSALRWSRMVGILGFMRPVLLQAVFWNVWFNADISDSVLEAVEA